MVGWSDSRVVRWAGVGVNGGGVMGVALRSTVNGLRSAEQKRGRREEGENMRAGDGENMRAGEGESMRAGEGESMRGGKQEEG